MTTTACIHQLYNARRQLKDVLKDAANNGSFYEVEVETARVEKKFHHLTEDNVVCAIEREEKTKLEVKARENRRNTQGSFKNEAEKFEAMSNQTRIINPVLQEYQFRMPAHRVYGNRQSARTNLRNT
jgi:hypothetical protein